MSRLFNTRQQHLLSIQSALPFFLFISRHRHVQVRLYSLMLASIILTPPMQLKTMEAHMHKLRAYKNLSPKTRLSVGVAILAWGAGGLMLADTVEETLGLTPTEEDKAKLDKYTPKIITVEKDEKSEN